jgi:hypothetical protein
MAFEITGKLVEISPVNQVSDKFRKREFVIEKKETGNAGTFVDFIKFQLVQDKCELINDSMLNQDIKITFNIKGNKWERDGKVNYFTNLDAWRIERTGQANSPDQEQRRPNSFEEVPPENEEFNDLPF